VVTDPHRDTVLQQVRFVALEGALSDYRLFVLLSPHLANQGGGNSAWVDELDSQSPLFARRESASLALACSAPWLKRSAGYVGSSDGFKDLQAHKHMTWEYARAENGLSAMSLAVLRTHESKTAPGDLIASLAIPWASARAIKTSGVITRFGCATWWKRPVALGCRRP
jgi:GH15 family glucan-1,4-alpha-glucosidase